MYQHKTIFAVNNELNNMSCKKNLKNNGQDRNQERKKLPWLSREIWRVERIN